MKKLEFLEFYGMVNPFKYEKLPAKYGEVINLHHKNGLKFCEIVVFLNEPMNTVKSKYRRGVGALKELL